MPRSTAGPVQGPRRAVVSLAVVVVLAIVVGGFALIRATRGDLTASAVGKSLSAPSSGGPASCSSGWYVAPQPDPPYADRLVAAGGSAWDDLWAVGVRFPGPGGTDREALLEHWDGEQWEVVPDAGLGPGAGLHAIAAVASDDVWAVGSRRDRPLMEHWNGRRWEVVLVPAFDPRNAGDTLDAITVASSENIWGLGHYRLNLPGVPATISRDAFLHWNGRTWAVVDSPMPVHPLDGTSAIQSIAVAKGGAVWGVGGKVRGFGEAGDLDGSLVERWDGRRWEIVEGPSGRFPLGMVAAADGEVWAARGDHLTTAGSYGFGGVEQILRWDGTAWAVSRRIPDGVLSGLTSRGDEVWAAGSTNSGRPLLLRRSEGAWETIFGPHGAAPDSISSGFSAVTVTGDGALVAFGSDYPFELGGQDRDPTDRPTNQLWINCPSS